MGTEFTHVLDSLGWAILHSVWQGGLAILFVIVWRAAVSGRSPALSHAGQIAALMGCMTAFIWTFAIYLGLTDTAANSGAALLTANSNEAPNLLTGLIAPFDPAAAQAGLSLSRITSILACLWALGFAFMSLRYAFAFGQVQQLRTLGIQRPDAAWTEQFRQLAKNIGVSKKVKLYISANVSGPVTLGFIKPVVLVPLGFLTGLPAEQVEAILRHELAHIRRNDYALNLIQTGVKTVLFYHPAIHIICRWADQDREQACDDLAVRQGRDPLILARGLAALRLKSHPTFGLAATGLGKDMPLMDRLTRLAGQTPKRGRPEHILMSMLSVLLLGSVYLGVSSRAEAHPVPPTVPDTIILMDSEPPVPPVPPVVPVPPVRPIMMKMDLSHLHDAEAMQRFMTDNKVSFKAFAKAMERYEEEMERYGEELETFLESSKLGEDKDEDYWADYEDFADDLADRFEERSEAFGEYLEDQIERQIEAREGEFERMGLDAALEGIKAAERAMRANPDSATKKLQLFAIEQARNGLEEARRDASLARSRADTARAHAETARENAAHARTDIEINRQSQQRHEAFRDTVMRELLQDGLIKSAKETVLLSHSNNVMNLNGKALPKALRGKYSDLLHDHGFPDNKTEISIKPGSLSILTDWKNGQHRTRVTYQSH